MQRNESYELGSALPNQERRPVWAARDLCDPATGQVLTKKGTKKMVWSVDRRELLRPHLDAKTGEMVADWVGEEPSEAATERTEQEQAQHAGRTLYEIPGIPKGVAKKLEDAGYRTVVELAKADSDRLGEVPGVGAVMAAKVKQIAEDALNQ